MKARLLSLFFIALNVFTLSAQTASLKGTLVDLDNNVTVANATVILSAGKSFEAKSDENGVFQFSAIPQGEYELKIQKEGYDELSRAVNVNEQEKNIGLVILSKSDENAERFVQDNVPVVTLTESDMDDRSSQNVSGVLSASRDAFISASSFNWALNWGSVRFRIRGYEGENFTTLMNGAPMNDLKTGQTYWNIWSGLNEVLRNRENSFGLATSTFAFGGIGGSNNLDTRAARQRKQTSASYAISNRIYTHRLMYTHSTGLLKKNWAVSLCFSKRWAKESYFPGTWFDGYSYFASVEKLIGFKHSISLTTFGTPTRSGRSTPSVQEMNDLAGTNYYNPGWGYQNGEKRNAIVSKNYQPLFVLNYEWKINKKSSLESAVSYLFGKNSVTGLDWYNAPDPRPDYYRNLPSLIEDSTLQQEAEELFSSSEEKRQIDWDNLYNVNYHNTETVADGIAGDSVTGRRSLYIVQNRVIKNQKLAVNMVYNNSLTEHLLLTSGVSYQRQTSNYYAEVNDLLGGDFFMDFNQFAEQDFPDSDTAAQNDLNRPNRLVREGEQYSYDYILTNCKTTAWLQTHFKYNHLDFFLAGELSTSRYWREGNTRVGLFPGNSFGVGVKQHFFNYFLKGGLTYKINGRNYLFGNAAYLTRAPLVLDALVSPRTRDQYAPTLDDTKIFSAEGGYYLKSPKIKGRLTGFFTQFNDQIQTYNFYHEDFRTQINYTLTDVDTRHMGIEFAVDARLWQGLSATAVASIGQYYYTSRPNATVTQDNSSEIIQNETIYAKNFFVSGSPQKAYTLGLSYRGKKFWFVNLSWNVFDDVYISFNPARRTAQAVDLVQEGSDQWNKIINQEEVNPDFRDKFTLDLSGGKSFKLNKERIRGYNYFMLLNVGISNIMNNKNLIMNGYEQLRFDFTEKNPDKFAPKYFYNSGITFFASLTFRMN